MKNNIAFISSLSFALLSSPATFAENTPIQQEYLKFKAHDRDVISFENGKRLSYKVISRTIKGDLEIITAKIDDPLQADLANYNNLIVTLDNQKQELLGFAETSDGHFQVDAKGTEGHLWKKVETPKVMDSILKLPEPNAKNTQQKISAAPMAAAISGDSEKDAAGNYVIDVFMGFSGAAAAKAGNISAYAEMQVSTVNTALKNSNIQGVYLRLVGVGTTPNNPGIIWQPENLNPLSQVKVWFKDDIARLQPDLIGIQQVQTGAAGSAGGWAGVGGDSDTQVVDIDLPGAWRHEVGHNVGGLHCKEAGDTGYNYGYSVREGRGTAMCGNDLAYYSSPLIHDDEGNVLGTAESQDMARVWRESMVRLATKRAHTVPYTSDSSIPVTLQAEDYLTANDTTPGNQGGAYRSDNVDIEATTDTGGGFNVGWIAPGEWLTYNIIAPTDGYYEFSYRVASLTGGGSIQLEKEGGSVVYGTIEVPATGGLQQWTTVKQVVALKAGSQNIALIFKTGDFNFNSFHVEKVVLGGTRYRLQSLWRSDQSLNIEHGALESSKIAPTLASGFWDFERVADTNYYLIKNHLKPAQSLNIETGKLESSSAGDGLPSAQWILEAVDGTTDQFRLKNRSKPELYINVESSLSVSTIQPGWLSAIWKFFPDTSASSSSAASSVASSKAASSIRASVAASSLATSSIAASKSSASSTAASVKPASSIAASTASSVVPAKSSAAASVASSIAASVTPVSSAAASVQSSVAASVAPASSIAATSSLSASSQATTPAEPKKSGGGAMNWLDLWVLGLLGLGFVRGGFNRPIKPIKLEDDL